MILNIIIYILIILIFIRAIEKKNEILFINDINYQKKYDDLNNIPEIVNKIDYGDILFTCRKKISFFNKIQRILLDNNCFRHIGIVINYNNQKYLLHFTAAKYYPAEILLSNHLNLIKLEDYLKKYSLEHKEVSYAIYRNNTVDKNKFTYPYLKDIIEDYKVQKFGINFNSKYTIFYCIHFIYYLLAQLNIINTGKNVLYSTSYLMEILEQSNYYQLDRFTYINKN